MKLFVNLKNEKGFALITIIFASIIMIIISGSVHIRAIMEGAQIEREITRISAQYAAEAGLQRAMKQIGSNAYTGYINENDIAFTLQNTNSIDIGTLNVDISYPSQADWVVVQSESTVNGKKTKLEGRVFLQSNLSKYMMYSPAVTHGYGPNLVIGFADTSASASAVGVPANELDRNLMYYTGNLSFNGANINVHGDIHVQGAVDGNNYTSAVYGDAYIGTFATNAQGAVTNDGLSENNNLTLNDGFSDDLDRDGNGVINSADAKDIHGLVDPALYIGGDSRPEETLTPINTAFYQANNNVPTYYGATAQNRYLKFEPAANGTSTRIVEYTNGNFTTATGTTYTLPNNAIVCVKGSAYIKGEIKGRVSVVATNDIMFAGNVKYAGGQNYGNENQNAAFLAQDKIFFLPSNLEVSGILYAEKSATGTNAISAAYKLASNGVDLIDDSGAKTNGHFAHYGNIIMEDGTISTAQYVNDRAFYYDPQMKYYRPPGLPVVPSLRMMRETTPSA